jgi:TolB protein
MLMKMVLIWVFLCSSSLFADAKNLYVPVGAAKTRATTFDFGSKPNMLAEGTPNSQKILESVQKVLTADLLLYSDFEKVAETPDLLIQMTISNGLTVKHFGLSVSVFHNPSAQQKLLKNYDVDLSALSALGHLVADDIYRAVTGSPSVFTTKIAASCMVKGGKKEIFVMNFDGSQTTQVTNDHSLALGPAWSPDGKSIAYSVYQGRPNGTKNIDLFELNLVTRHRKLLSNKKGINSGATYSPDGQKLALTMSYSGFPMLYLLDLKTLRARKLQNTVPYDVDPMFSPDGHNLAYVSNRAGNPMIFKMSLSVDPALAKADRLTYAGKYNATPHWLGEKIVFAGWIEGLFDIFTMNEDGTNIERLTKGQGNNEDPYFSPDGKFIVFSSNRADGRKKDLYTMNRSGGAVRRLTFGMQDCVSPKWSTFIK